MWTMCMAEEGANENISALAIAPGIVDTGMQEEIRNADESSFPLLQNFKITTTMVNYQNLMM